MDRADLLIRCDTALPTHRQNKCLLLQTPQKPTFTYIHLDSDSNDALGVYVYFYINNYI